MTRKKKDTTDATNESTTTDKTNLAVSDEVVSAEPQTEPQKTEDKKDAPVAVQKKHPIFKVVDKGEKNGVYVLVDVDDNGKPIYSWLCSFLRVVAVTRDDSNENWGRLLEVLDRDGVVHEWAMPSSMMAGLGVTYREVLLSLGLDMAPGKDAQKDLHRFIATARPQEKARCVDKVGWHHNRYILPDGSYGEDSGDIVVFQNNGLSFKYEINGNLEEWQNQIGRYCVGNSRLVLAVTSALAGTLLHLVSEESGGYNLYGHSSGGKTTALHVGASIFGARVRTWRTTDNAAENMALCANDNTLFLDELSQVDGRIAANMVYMLGNGQRKQRMNSNTTSRPEMTWRIVFLSSGEVTLKEKMMEFDKKYLAGQGVRLVDIPADSGAGYMLFESLHGFKNGDVFSQHLRLMSAQHSGTVGRAFLEYVANNVDVVRANVQERVVKWCEENVSDDADPQVKRVGRRFALLAAAGEIATQIGLLPWPEDEANEGVARCFDDWIRMRGGEEDSTETSEAVRQVLNILETQGSARFMVPAGEGISEKVYHCLGFRTCGGSDGNIEYYVNTSGFREMCKGFNSKTVARMLVDKEFMTGEEGNGKRKKTSVSKAFVGHGKQRYYHFTTPNMEKMRKYVEKLG